MKLKFQKDLDYQIEAINSVVSIFDTGRNLEIKNNFSSINDFNLMPSNNIQTIANNLEIDREKIIQNIKNLQEKNNICEINKDTKEITKYILDEENYKDFSVEMETGTGKTYVYLRTIFELNKKYDLKKFIILVPSVAIREGVLKTIEQTRDHFKNLYDVNFKGFAYDSDKLNEVRDFVQANDIFIMIMTVQSFSKDTNIMRQAPDRFNGNRPIDLVANTNPVIIMDEPQNMETDLAKEAIKDLNPIFKLRYSATHKEIYNLVYKLTPIDAYKKNLVKKIEVYGVKEEDANDFTFKVREIKTERGQNPKAKVMLKIRNAEGEYSDKEILLKVRDNLFRKTNNEAYKDLVVFDVDANQNRIELSNRNFYKLDEESENKEDIFRVQIRETIKAHFHKQEKLKDLNIKVLSLFFIDKVDNYIHNDSLIRNIFNEEFNKLKKDFDLFKDLEVADVHKGYFASKKVKGNTEYIDSREKSTEADKEAFDLIMKDKERLLSFDDKVSFIFSHSALKEGWDNPNIFQICTLRETNSVMKKRQEVGRGLRLPVNQDGQRVYDTDVNILTVIPNESYRQFCSTYQAELDKSGYKYVEPGNAREKVSIGTTKYFESEDFKELWKRISQRTKYNLEIKTGLLVKKIIEEINKLNISSPIIKVESASMYFGDKDELKTTITNNKIGAILNKDIQINNFLDRIVKETDLTKNTVLLILSQVQNFDFIFENYEEYLRYIILIIQKQKENILINGGLKYIPIGEFWEANTLYKDLEEVFKNKSIEIDKSVTNRIVFDSLGEKDFAMSLDNNSNVKVFTKLPRGFIIDTPLGKYIPDWAIVYDKEGENKLYLVRETKFYKGEEFEESLSKEELGKIECAKKHFETIGVDYKVIQDQDLVDLT